MAPTTKTTASGTGSTPDTKPAGPDDRTKPNRPRIVVLGGGMAGLTAAGELRRLLGDRAAITLVSERTHFTLGPALLWVPFGRPTATISMPIQKTLARQRIGFLHARAEHIDPERHVVLAGYNEIPYDYLLIATGPRVASTAIPGIAGEFNASTSIYTETEALAARQALERFLAQPGPAVIGAAQGAPYLSAAYEFALLLDHALRRRGLREQARLTFVTPEPVLGHLDLGLPAAERLLARLFAQRQIQVIAGAQIARVDHEGVQLQDGTCLPAVYTMLLPPVTDVTGVWTSAGLTDAQGFIPVDAHYRHARYPQIYAVGVAARPMVAASGLAQLPKTGYLAAAMARAAARNVAAAVQGQRAVAAPLPRLLDVRVLDGGDTGVLLVAADLGRRWGVALRLPDGLAHRLKGLMTRYLLWKLRTGRTTWL